MSTIKINCVYCPPRKPVVPSGARDWEAHPSLTAGMEALTAYHDWVSGLVLPIAFQWIEEHKEEVYASVAEEHRDDVGVVIAAAFKLIKELPVYKSGLERRAEHEANAASATFDPSTINPVWAGVAGKVRACTEEAFAEQASLLADEEE